MRQKGTLKSSQIQGHEWTFLSNHLHVLLCLFRDPEMRLRDVAQLVKITERAVQGIVLDLEEAGVLRRIKQGRRNRYEIHVDRMLRHPLEEHVPIGKLLELLR
ncbi:MAG: ArsR family transcriptional regulator [Leptospiraceae bacterium]|nr:ArsR family transcriptional regulator [Leptospiraceae bacterium]MCB1304630.1 ArsR family transcriptional regulator [Leptospiraceae bacterium]